jgi:hypothetical protein
MIFDPEQPARDPFGFRELFVLPIPIGRAASNLRELLRAPRELNEMDDFCSWIASNFDLPIGGARGRLFVFS